MDYSIGEFSRVTGLGIHTLRYYEHENLVSPSRNSSDRRRYSEKDIAWIAFIKRLKATGMPIKEIKKYVQLRATRRSRPCSHKTERPLRPMLSALYAPEVPARRHQPSSRGDSVKASPASASRAISSRYCACVSS